MKAKSDFTIAEFLKSSRPILYDISDGPFLNDIENFSQQWKNF